MNNKLEILSDGFADDINVLSENEMDEIIGGDVDCKKKYAEGHVECHQRYTEKDGYIRCSKNFIWTN